MRASRRTAALMAMILLAALQTQLNAPPAEAHALVSSKDWSGEGVTVCHNEHAGCTDPKTGKSVGWRCCEDNGTSGQQWQCVELALRYWQDAGWHSGLFGIGPAEELWYDYPNNMKNVARYENGTPYRPVLGDLVVHGNGPSSGAGHVTVVDRAVADGSGGYTVYAMEQNASDSGKRQYTVSSSGTWNRGGHDDPVLGVIHSKENTAEPTTPDPVSPPIIKKTGAYQIDFDGNGKTDIIRTNGSDWYVSYDGTTTWQHRVTSGYKLADLEFGDFDGDGLTDVFRSSGSAWYVVYGDDPTPSWTLLRNVSAPLSSGLGFADFNGDGKTDVFRVKDVPNTTTDNWEVSYGGTSSWNYLRSSAATWATGFAFGDFDGDGKADVFRSNNGWYVSYGGTEPWTRLGGSGYKVEDLHFGDFDGDGQTDVFRATGDWYVAYSGKGDWVRVSTLDATNVGIGDFDGETPGLGGVEDPLLGYKPPKADVFRANGDWWVAYNSETGWEYLGGSGYTLPDIAFGYHRPT